MRCSSDENLLVVVIIIVFVVGFFFLSCKFFCFFLQLSFLIFYKLCSSGNIRDLSFFFLIISLISSGYILLPQKCISSAIISLTLFIDLSFGNIYIILQIFNIATR